MARWLSLIGSGLTSRPRLRFLAHRLRRYGDDFKAGSVLLWIVSLCALAVLSPTGVQAQADSPLAIARALVAAESAHNVEAAVALFADDATVVVPLYTRNTREGIRAWQQELADQNFEAEFVSPQVDGNWVTWTGKISLDPWRRLGVAPLDGQWEMTVEAGRIKFFRFSLTPDSTAKLQAAMTGQTTSQTLPTTGSARLPFTWLLIGGLSLLGGLVLRLYHRRNIMSSKDHD